MNKIGGISETEELPYLTIEALEDGLTVKLSTNTCQYSTDGVTWTNLVAGTATPAINTGEKLYFKATGLRPSSSAGIGTFTVNKQFNLSGNCMSMLFGDEAESNLDLTGKEYAFHRLFYDCAVLKSVSAGFLPATTLASSCYRYMFRGCTRLTTAPELPATTLKSYCYYCMFSGCSNLITAPQLPATALADYCYYYMFSTCSSLTITPELPATTLADFCYGNMFSGTNLLPDCTNIDFSSSIVVRSGGLRGLFAGTKVTDSDLRRILPINPDTGNYWLPVMTLTKSHCYSYMFHECTNLTTAPELPATTLSVSCYSYMFRDCSNLTTTPNLPATTLTDYCYYSMFYNCSNLTTAPELPAITLIEYCYYEMFQKCSKLNYIKAMFTTTPIALYTKNWVSGVASTGTFVKNAAATWDVTGVNGVPSGWTIETASV